MTYRNAARYRTEPTEAERRLWSVLRDRRLSGYRFRRQHPIGPYVADFACVRHRIVVELDGSQHAVRNRVGVLETILDALAARPSPASLREAPSPRVGRG